jgi:hypothetical protein
MSHLLQIEEILEKYYKWDRRRLNFLGNTIGAIIRSRSVNLQKIAESIEGKAQVESNYRRVQRLFQLQEIDYNITAKLLSSVLPNDEKWILTMDRTNWKLGKSNINLLVLGVAYKGMAIPLLWDFLTIQEDDIRRGKRGNSNSDERKSIIKRFIELFGVEKIEALTADREFIGEEWFKWLEDNKIPFVIRIRNTTTLNERQLGTSNTKELFKHIQKDEFYGFGECDILGRRLHLGGIEATKSKEPLMLVSNRPMNTNTISIYQKRWEIETMFGAFKSKGFNLEESKLSEGYKIQKLMALLSIAFVWSILAGDYRALKKPIAYKKKNHIR